MHLRWNGKYGQFSKAYYDTLFDGENILLQNPELVVTDPELFFTSALWQYMTPQYPKPSAHDVMTGFFNPNGIDVSAGADNNFGSTIAILVQDEEHPTSLKVCNTSSNTKAAKALANIFVAFN